MPKDTDNTKQEVLAQNPGLDADKQAYVYVFNKDKPAHYGQKTLKDEPRKHYNSIAIRTDKIENYLCIDIDGHTDLTADNKDYNQDKLRSVESIKENLITLLEQYTKKYRLDRTASGKYHLWLKHPPGIIKELLQIKDDDFLTLDGKKATGIIEVFSKFNKHSVHLAGSSITDDIGNVKHYTNIYAGATFDKLDYINNIRDIITSAVVNAGYLVNIKNPEKATNSIKYDFHDISHDGYIKETHNKGNIYFSYCMRGAVVKKHFYITDKDNFTIDSINASCDDEFKNIILSIFYYHQYNQNNNSNTDADNTIINDEISKQLIELYSKYWQNTDGQRHYLILATSNLLVDYFNFNKSDLESFFNDLSDAVDIKSEHRHTIFEGLRDDKDNYNLSGAPTIVKILGCKKQEIAFLKEYNSNFNNELQYLEKIKPTLTTEIINDENNFNKLFLLQQENQINLDTNYIKIDPTQSITNFISQVISNGLLNENKNISRLLLALIGVVIGTNRTYIIISGVSSGGKSALVDAVKEVIPAAYKSEIDDLSEAAFTRHTQDKGQYVYNRTIIDYGDKGDIKGYEKAVTTMAKFQNLITKGTYTYQVTNQINKTPKGTINLTIVTDGFAQIITTTKDALAQIDEQLITRSEILYISAKNTKNAISDFNAKPGIDNTKDRIKQIAKVIQNHILFNLNKYSDTNVIIIAHWRYYITELLKANNGVNREIDATMNALKAYAWLEISRLNKVIGTDGKAYYIPDSNILWEFINIYGVKSYKGSDTDKQLIKALTDEENQDRYIAIDDTANVFIDDSIDLSTANNRKCENVFTYLDIENFLKNSADNIGIYKKIDNVSHVLRKLENSNILGRLSDKVKGNVVYYIKKESAAYNNEVIIKDIDDASINHAINHLKYHEILKQDNNIFGKDPLKFDDSIDFSFIDKRNTNQPGKDKDDNDNVDDPKASTKSASSSASIIGQDNMNIKSTNQRKTEETINNIAKVEVIKQRKTEKASNYNTTIKNVAASGASAISSAPGIDENNKTGNLVNLHCHSDESTGDGATSIDALIDAAIANGQKALALTNHGTLNGLYKFNKQCQAKGIKAILGIEAYITKNRYHLILLAKNYKGYQDLLTLHNKNVEYMKEHNLKTNDNYVNGGIYYSNLEQDKELCSNLICLSGCISGEIPQLLLNNEYEKAKRLATTYNTIFNQFYLELQYNGLKEQEKLNKLLIELANDTGIALTVSGDVHYISNKDNWHAIKDANKKGRKAPESNNSFMVTAPEQLAETTRQIAQSIQEYEIETALHIPKPKHKRDWLRKYCYDKLKQYNIYDPAHIKRLEKELTIIKDEIADYHILLYEIVEAIKDIAGDISGRGSAVGSLVCYLLGFHDIDPLKYGLLFERFLNAERIEQALKSDSINTAILPDIDLNIDNSKKDEVFKRLENYCTENGYYIAKVRTYAELKQDGAKYKDTIIKYPGADADIVGLKYIMSKHAGGVILSTESFAEYLPVTLTRGGEIITDCHLTEVEARGGIKYDLLSQSSSKINSGIKLNDNELDKLAQYINKYPLGISEFTGYQGRKYLKENKITCFNDLIKAIALMRPGSNEHWTFQEDMMQEAIKYGISYADADYLRKPRGTEQEKQEKLEKIINTMKSNGCTEQDAKKFKDYHINYGFNKSHAVAYAIESLKNAKRKRDDTATFFAMKLNHTKENKIKTAELFDDAIKLGVKIIPPGRDNYNQLETIAKDNKLYVGVTFINGIGDAGTLDKKGKLKKVYKEYLKKMHQDKLYSLGAYDPKKLNNNIICLGYETAKKYKKKYFNNPAGNNSYYDIMYLDIFAVATISANGFKIRDIDKKELLADGYKAKDLFFKGAIIAADIVKKYELE